MKLRSTKCEVRSAAGRLPRSRGGFTIIEIALCLGIIAFALVAIIGVLPFGMRVQQQNREETIIDQDATVWMDAIRSGARGYDDLTNYVIGITNFWTQFGANRNVVASGTEGYSFYGSTALPRFGLGQNTYPLTNGLRIIGLLSQPQLTDLNFNPTNDISGGGYSNYVYAYVRSMSGAEVEKAPQTNENVLNDAFTYKLIAENVGYVPFDTNTIDFSQANNWTVAATNNARVVRTLQANSRDLRVTFLWALLPNGDFGNGRQTFRTLTASPLTNDPPAQPLYFFRPSTYVQVQ